MKKRNRIAIIITVVLIVVAGLLIFNNRYLTTIRGEAADFMVRDTAAVTKIYLADRHQHETLLERQTNGWSLNKEYKAHPKKIDQILYTMNKVRIRMPVSVSSHDNVISRMAGESVKVEVYQNVPAINLFNRVKLFWHEKRTKVFYVGDVTKDNSGTFMLKEGADKAYIVSIPGFRGFISTRFTADPDDWRDHTIFKESLGNIQSVSVDFPEHPESSFSIESTGKHQYKMTRLSDQSNIAFDTLKVVNFLSSFSDLRFEALLNNALPQERIDSIAHSTYLNKITLTTKDGEVQEMKTFKKKLVLGLTDLTEDQIDFDNDRMYGLINGGKDLVLIQYFIFDRVLHPAEYFEKGQPIQYEVQHYQILN